VELAPLAGQNAHPFPRWLLLEVRGELNEPADVLRGIAEALTAARTALQPPVPSALDGWFDLNLAVLCESLTSLGSECVSE
jgi:hypothetical protein